MNTRRSSLTCLAALLAAAAILPAQGGRGGTNRLDFLAGYLTLTEAQKTQAATIFTAADTAKATLQGQMTAARDALQAAVKANRADAELDRLAAAVGVIHGQSAAVEAKANARFYALLTAEQKTKFDALGDRGPGGAGRQR